MTFHTKISYYLLCWNGMAMGGLPITDKSQEYGDSYGKTTLATDDTKTN